MNVSQVRGAVAQMRTFLEEIEDAYNRGTGEYRMVSARGVLYDLGFDESEADDVIHALADGGFDYCIDPIIVRRGERVSRDVCYFGFDQLLSRIECARLPREEV